MRLIVITACSFHEDLPNIMVFLYFGISVFLVVIYGGVGGVGDPLTFSRNAVDGSADVSKEPGVQDLGTDYRTEHVSDYVLTDPYGGHNGLGNQGPTDSYVGNMDTGYIEYGADYGLTYRDQTDQVDQDYGAQYGLRDSYESHIEPVKTRGRIVDFEDLFTKRRKRRSFLQAGVGIWRGIRATNKLLTDATKVFRSKAFTLYEKKGGRIKAAEDFESVRPRNVIDHGVQKTGYVGDRTIILTAGDADYPTLTIYIPKRIPNKYVTNVIDNIVYKD